MTQGAGYACSGTGSVLTFATVSGLNPGDPYWSAIQAVNGVGAGPMSNERTADATP